MVQHVKNLIAGLALIGFLMAGTAANAADGKAVFDAKCGKCHAVGKKWPLTGISKKGYSDAKLQELSFTNPPKKMKPVQGTPDEMKAVVQYLKTL